MRQHGKSFLFKSYNQYYILRANQTHDFWAPRLMNNLVSDEVYFSVFSKT